MNKAVITKLNLTFFLFIYEEDELVECHPFQMEKSLRIGNVYIGRVDKVVRNIQSAFIRLDSEQIGYLPLDSKPYRVLNRNLPKGLPSIAENDQILVQVEQEPQKMKQVRVTGNISCSGRYVSLDLQRGRVGVSKKIRDLKRSEELKKLAWNPEYGCIFRTACETVEDSVILEEYNRLAVRMEQLLQKAVYEKKCGCILEGKTEVVGMLEEYGINRIDKIVTDSSEIQEMLVLADIACSFYEDEFPLVKLLNLESEMDRLLHKKVWLKSGGFLVIEPTEAMVVIDVNSGKSIKNKKKENHILATNLEAAKEIAHQLRLRNLSGIIMIDFINMEKKEHQNEVISCLEQELKKDKVPSYFVEVTKLGIFELTRKKIRKPLHESLINKM